MRAIESGQPDNRCAYIRASSRVCGKRTFDDTDLCSSHKTFLDEVGDSRSANSEKSLRQRDNRAGELVRQLSGVVPVTSPYAEAVETITEMMNHHATVRARFQSLGSDDWVYLDTLGEERAAADILGYERSMERAAKALMGWVRVQTEQELTRLKPDHVQQVTDILDRVQDRMAHEGTTFERRFADVFRVELDREPTQRPQGRTTTTDTTRRKR